ncbi:hypothetical protein B0T25DRAFT_536883 [Lasiosphaeria hispida]|uniref:Uncharacterized protein n=1 Tax=Lasiosphaeria hispida TaxID=260671 RepID=A0AAJ0HKH2_9PEZI|nr:hypothetical protein B0T25DRAFT_536883 [Lasiosphaeria hispida]
MSELRQSPPRPPTPQAMLHRLPDKPLDMEITIKPSRYIILIFGSTAVAGKAQIARSVASALSCALYQGDSLHESSAKAASVGSSRPTTIPTVAVGNHVSPTLASPGPNKARYQRMWLSKLTRTGLLFPEASRPATEGFFGFGGISASPRPTSRRSSASSFASASSGNLESPTPSGISSGQNDLQDRPMYDGNPALMVLTHPELEKWHKLALRTAVEDYGVGVIFVPLYAENEAQAEGDEDADGDLPILRPLDPTMTSFPASSSRNFGASNHGIKRNLDGETKLHINMNADVDSQTVETINGVRAILGISYNEAV